MNALLNNIAFLGLTVMAFSAQAQSSFELTCRAKAKEIATQTYSSCVTDARNTQIDQIRKDYQKQLADLKAKYDKELKKVSGKTIASPATAKPTPLAASKSAPPKPTKGVAKTLPTRPEAKPAAPVQEVQEDRTVVSPDSTTPGMDDSASQNDAQGDLSIKLVPATTPQDKSAATSDEQVY